MAWLKSLFGKKAEAGKRREPTEVSSSTSDDEQLLSELDKELNEPSSGKATASCAHCGTATPEPWDLLATKDRQKLKAMGMKCDQCGSVTCPECSLRADKALGAGTFVCPECSADLKKQYAKELMERRRST